MNCGAGAEVLLDKCAACLTCLRVCPFDIPKVTDVARIDSALCQSCGICIAECPANAIIARGWDKDELKARTAEILHSLGTDRKIAAFICGYRASTAAWRGEEIDVPTVAQVYLPSLARLSVADVLKAFENGADVVVVVTVGEDNERYPQAAKRIDRRVQEVRRMLVEIGMDGQCLKMIRVAGDTDSIRTALVQAAQELEKIVS